MSNATTPEGATKTIITPEGTFTKIRERGPTDAHGGFDVELWAKKGVSVTDTVYTPMLCSTTDQPTFMALAGLVRSSEVTDTP